MLLSARRCSLTAPKPLSPDQLSVSCDQRNFEFETTKDLKPLKRVIGQDRAVEAILFGMGIRRTGFNVFAFGRHGSGKSTTIQMFLTREAKNHPPSAAWCYVYNFNRDAQAERRPKALSLPPGCASNLRTEMNHMIEDLLVFLPAAFEDDTYQARRNGVAEAFEEQSREDFDAASKAAGERGLAVVQSPEGVGILPLKEEGEVLSPDEFRALPEDEQKAIRESIDATRLELEEAAKGARAVQREARRTLDALDREIASGVVENCMEQVRESCGNFPGVADWLEDAEADILEHLELFRPDEDADDEDPTAEALARRAAEEEEDGLLGDLPSDGSTARSKRLSDHRLRRYEVNVLVEHDPDGGAPVVVASHPTLANLVGRLEYQSQFGTLSTDFTRLRPGALHQANGGYLVMEASEVLKQPFAWDALKRALRNKEIRLETPGGGNDTSTTVTLEPEPIPLDVKVILIGESMLYYMLHMGDPDFPELFKVPAEFGVTMLRTDESIQLYSRFIATVAQREGMLPFRRCAVARVVDQGARLADDSQRLSTHFLTVTDLLRESDYWATKRKAKLVRVRDVEKAIESRINRLDLARELRHENYSRGIVLLDTTGSQVGEINALTVLARGEFMFGLPVRITARVRLGAGDVIDIEREVDLSGPLHSKGVLILSGFIGGRYVPEDSLAMMASITFEQTYGGVDGDSASSAELYALLSALSDLPINQSFAVTGSVNQVGDVQAIGGVNEKIEGFFDICRERGLTGDQGVLIPESNVQHLMLRSDVIKAVKSGEFSIYPVSSIDEGIELLVGVPAGERADDGQFPEGTVNRMVEDRLLRFAERRRELSPTPDEED